MAWPLFQQFVLPRILKRLFAVFAISFLTISAKAQFLSVEGILIQGLEKTRQVAILREMTFGVGDSLHVLDLDTLLALNRSNIYNTGLFNVVEIKADVDSMAMQVMIHISVKERWYILPAPIFELEERTLNEWLAHPDLDRLTYGIGLDWNNLTGRNDNLDLVIYNGYSRGILAGYYKPYLLPAWKIDGEMSVTGLWKKEIGYTTKQAILQLLRLPDQRVRESLSGRISFLKRLTARNKLGLSFGYVQVTIADSVLALNPDYLTGSSTLEWYPYLSFFWFNDQRDWKAFPLSGYKCNTEIRYSGPGGTGTSSFFHFLGNASAHLPLSNRWNIAGGIRAALLQGQKVPYYEKLFIGTSTSMLNGYEPYVIDASAYAMAKTELKFALIPRKIIHVKQIPFRKFADMPLGLYLHSFVNAGIATDAVQGIKDPYLKDRGLIGYGVGVTFLTLYDWMLRIEASRNHLGQGGIYFHGTVSIR